MKEIYLHIGTPKTGTTTIQKNLSNNINILNKIGYHYPITGLIGNAHHNIGFDSSAKHNPNLKYSFLTDICQEMKNSDFKKFIISTETLTWLTKEEVRRLKTVLAEFKTTIVLCLRRQDELFASFWSHQVINALNEKSFVEFYTSFLNNRDIEKKYSKKCIGCFDKLLSNWSEVFGIENIRIYLNDFPKRNLLQHFFSCCDIKFQNLLEEGFIKEKQNSSVSPPLEILNLIQKIARNCPNISPEILLATSKYIQHFTRTNLSKYPKNYILDEPTSIKIMSFYNEVNRNIAKDFLKEEKLFHGKRNFSASTLHTDVIEQHYVGLFTQLLNHLYNKGYLSVERFEKNKRNVDNSSRLLFERIVSKLQK